MPAAAVLPWRVPSADILFTNGTNTYSGGTTILPGAYVVFEANTTVSGGSITSGPFGTGTLNLAGGNLRGSGGAGGTFTLANPVTISASTTFYSFGTNNDHNLAFTGPVQLVGGTQTITVQTSPVSGGPGVTFNGSISDSGSGYGITLNGPGTLAARRQQQLQRHDER